MNEQILHTLEQIMQAINTNLPVVMSKNPDPAQRQSLLDSQQAATANYQQARALSFDANDPAVQQAAQALQTAQSAVNASLNDLNNISAIINALANAVTAGAQIVALGASL